MENSLSFIIRPYRSKFDFEEDMDIAAFTLHIAQTIVKAIKNGIRSFALALYSPKEEQAVVDTFFDFKRVYPDVDFFFIYNPYISFYDENTLAFLEKQFRVVPFPYKVKLTYFVNILKRSAETVFVLERRRYPKYLEYALLYAEVNRIPVQVLYADDDSLL